MKIRTQNRFDREQFEANNERFHPTRANSHTNLEEIPMPKTSFLLAVTATCFAISLNCSGLAQDLSQASVDDKPPQEIQRELVVQFAVAKRNLAKVELERVLSRGEAYPKFLAARLKAQLNVAEEHLRQTVVAASDGATEVRRRHAQEQLRLAEVELNAGRHLMQTTSDFDELDLRRLALKKEIASLKIELINNPATYLSMMDAMEARMHQFSDEILSLEQRIARLENLGR